MLSAVLVRVPVPVLMLMPLMRVKHVDYKPHATAKGLDASLVAVGLICCCPLGLHYAYGSSYRQWPPDVVNTVLYGPSLKVTPT